MQGRGDQALAGGGRCLTVVVADLPRHLRLAAGRPDRRDVARNRRQIDAAHPVGRVPAWDASVCQLCLCGFWLKLVCHRSPREAALRAHVVFL